MAAQGQIALPYSGTVPQDDKIVSRNLPQDAFSPSKFGRGVDLIFF